MNYLFVHQNFPGQFLHLVRHLVAQQDHEIVFITEQNENVIPGVRRFVYQAPVANLATFDQAAEFETALVRGRIVMEMGQKLRTLGFVPDIIIGHHGWGEMLEIGDVWPGVPMLGYFEFYYRERGFDIGFDPEFPDPPGGYGKLRAKNAVNLLALQLPGHGQTPTRFQASTYPGWAQDRITVLPEGVNLDACRPDPAVRRQAQRWGDMVVEPGDTLVTFVSRDLEPYRGFHTLMRAVPELQRLSPTLKVVMVGGDGVSYGARLGGMGWREYMWNQVGDRIDPARVAFPGKVPYEDFLRLLQRSDAHVYLTYPFVLSWSLREAMACGCAIVGSRVAPVEEFVTDERSGLLIEFPNSPAIVAAVERLMRRPVLAKRLRREARAEAERTLRMDRYIDGYERLIRDVMARGPQER